LLGGGVRLLFSLWSEAVKNSGDSVHVRSPAAKEEATLFTHYFICHDVAAENRRDP
jgi:hypothetical protein